MGDTSSYFDWLPNDIILQIANSIAPTPPLKHSGFWKNSAAHTGKKRRWYMHGGPNTKASSILWHDVKGFAVYTAERNESLVGTYMELYLGRRSSRASKADLMSAAYGEFSCSGCAKHTVSSCPFKNRPFCAPCSLLERKTRILPMEVAHCFYGAENLANFFDVGFLHGMVLYRMKDEVSSPPEISPPVWELHAFPNGQPSLEQLSKMVALGRNSRIEVFMTALRLRDETLCRNLATTSFGHLKIVSTAVSNASEGKPVDFVGLFRTILEGRCIQCNRATRATCQWFGCYICQKCHQKSCGILHVSEAMITYGILPRIFRDRQRVCMRHLEAFSKVAYGMEDLESVPGEVWMLREIGMIMRTN